MSLTDQLIQLFAWDSIGGKFGRTDANLSWEAHELVN